jgi:pimeloyl-ACP methyl ester carboxylesterase
VNAKIPGPYVLVAHSLAGKSAQLFARHRMDEMAGVVLVDARSEYVDGRTSSHEQRAFIETVENQGRLYAIARCFGIVRVFGADLAGTAAMSRDARTLMALVSTEESAIAATTAEARFRTANDAELRAAPTLGALPLVVLASDQSIALIPHWAEAQRRLAGLSSDGRLIVARGSSHAIAWDRPRLVIDEIYKVIVQVRSARAN